MQMAAKTCDKCNAKHSHDFQEGPLKDTAVVKKIFRVLFLPAGRGIEPGTAEWEARVLPLSYAVPPKEPWSDLETKSFEILLVKAEG